MLKRAGLLGLIIVITAIVSSLLSFLLIKYTITVDYNLYNFITFAIFFFIVLFLLDCVFMSGKFAVGKKQEVIFFVASTALMGLLLGFILFALLKAKFEFSHLDWFGYLCNVVSLQDLKNSTFAYLGISFLFQLFIIIIYVTFIDRRIIQFTKGGLRGQGSLKQVDSNLENSRWMNKEEREKYFKKHKYSELKNTKKDGVPVGAVINKKKNDMIVEFNSPCHSIIIGSTGSGKTTTFVTPMIQLLGATAAGSSMIITDPKGELFGLHSKFLKSRGYDVKVIDLRDTYQSYRWNPLDPIWDTYQKYLFAYKEAYERTDNPAKSGLKLGEPIENFDGLDKWYEFNNTAYANYDMLVQGINVYKKKTFDEVYEDINDLVSVLIPVDNPNDPMWEKGARSIVLAVLLGMLEDSADESLGMTKEKFNFFNMTKILQNSSDDYIELRNYFAGRNILSKAYSLSKQVCDCADTTRASYMSIVYEKLTMFNDAGICALTSASDFNSEQLAHKPTALFLKIPDEKDTRHNLAAIFILNIYKTLIKVASATEELTLDRNVYFIMDEFGNMPKIEKFDKFITVGRSRKIWFIMIIQSYAQLNNVYGDTVADIVKGNCGIKMFIGSNDMGTCKEYSELCGNITVVTTSTSGSAQSNDISISSQTQVRPLIYPSELQRLNHPGDIGHSIIVTFGNYPLKTYFTPSFVVPLYQMGKMDTSDTERFFDEDKILYNIKDRNNAVLGNGNNSSNNQGESSDTQSGGIAKEQEQPKEGIKIDTVKVEVPREQMEESTNKMDLIELNRLFSEFKNNNINATLEDFFKEMNNVNKEK